MIKAFKIYENRVADSNLIGNLELEVVKAIHGDNITTINKDEKYVIVKRDTYECEECGMYLAADFTKFVGFDNDIPVCPECYETWIAGAKAESDYEDAMYNEAMMNAIGEKVCTGCRQTYTPIMKDDGDCCPSCARY